MKTTSLKLKDIKRNWYIIDCTDKIIGRVATKAAVLLQGKHKPMYADNLNIGDHVILINTSKIKWTGKKGKQKIYKRHTGYQSGLKEKSLDKMMITNPNVVMENAISKMLPKNKKRDVYLAQLHTYKEESHSHEAQQPQHINI